MTDEEGTAVAARVYAALVAAEARHPDSHVLAILHAALADAWELIHVAHPGIIQPFDGTAKPPQNP